MFYSHCHGYACKDIEEISWNMRTNQFSESNTPQTQDKLARILITSSAAFPCAYLVWQLDRWQVKGKEEMAVPLILCRDKQMPHDYYPYIMQSRYIIYRIIWQGIVCTILYLWGRKRSYMQEMVDIRWKRRIVPILHTVLLNWNQPAPHQPLSEVFPCIHCHRASIAPPLLCTSSGPVLGCSFRWSRPNSPHGTR